MTREEILKIVEERQKNLDLKVRNLISKVFYGENDWEGCDIPTRELIDEFMAKLHKKVSLN